MKHRLMWLFFLVLVAPLALTNPAQTQLGPPTFPAIDNFETYPTGEPVNGQPGWESSDNFYSKGWIVTDDGANPAGHKYICFWPSPWPGGFSFASNYAKWHVRSLKTLTSLSLALDYMILTNGDMKVFLSGDNATWVEVTGELGLEKFNSGPFRQAEADLTHLIDAARINKDVYVKLQAAAYSGEYWQSCVDRLELKEACGQTQIFGDVPPDHWAYKYIQALACAGITKGCIGDNPETPENEARFCPDEVITRDQMAAFLARALLHME